MTAQIHTSVLKVDFPRTNVNSVLKVDTGQGLCHLDWLWPPPPHPPPPSGKGTPWKLCLSDFAKLTLCTGFFFEIVLIIMNRVLFLYFCVMLTFVLFIYFCKAYCILRIHKVFPKILMSRCVVPWPQIKMSNTEHLGGKILSNNFMATTEARAGFRCQDEAPILKHTFEMPCSIEWILHKV